MAMDKIITMRYIQSVESQYDSLRLILKVLALLLERFIRYWSQKINHITVKHKVCLIIASNPLMRSIIKGSR